MHPRILVVALALFATFTISSSVTAQSDSTADASVVDEGDVAATTQGLQGSSNAATSTACASCSTVGASGDTPPLAALGGLFALGAMMFRRRRD